MSALPSFIMGFREALEAFLLIAIMLKYISGFEGNILKLRIYQGVGAAIVLSIGLGWLLNAVSQQIEELEAMTKVWESFASLIAITLVTFFIVWMVKHGADLVKETKQKIKANFSEWGLFFLALIIVGREGAEVTIFTFAGQYNYLPVFAGIFAGLFLTLLIFFSLVKLDLSLLFKVTLAYLILQAGYLLGYAIHEGLSALKAYGLMASDHLIYIKLFDVSHTFLSHSSGSIGIFLHALLGWYSKPEWIQFIIQYAYTLLMFIYWINFSNRVKI